MILDRMSLAGRRSFLENKVTLKRLGAPLLYAYDASSFMQRLRGLHAVPPLGPTDALILRPCKVIHSFGMDRPIDVIFMNRDGDILKLVTLQPKRVLFCWRAYIAVEMALGTASRLSLNVGQQFLPDHGQWR